jgi:site-specific DNA-methyltransferase (adenine-specific)
MNSRKLAHQRGLKVLARSRQGLLIPSDNNGRARASAYNARRMTPTNEILQGDCVRLLNDLPPEWVDLCFADPPFNIGYLYHNYDDQKDVTEYVDWSERWMRAVYHALKPTGSFYLAIGDEVAADLCVVARRKIGFHLRNWIVWHYTFGQQTKKMFAKSHTHILYFTKEKPNGGMTNLTFNADAVRVASARQTTYADARANPKGKLPDDTWFLRPQEAAPHAYFEPGYDTWNESRVCGTFREREGWHGCQMPVAVLNRIIRASSNPGDVVLDPFNGSGTTVVSAALLGRKYIGIDQSEEYVGYAKKRLEHALAHTKTAGDGNGVSQNALNDPNRASRVMTETDSFGRARVPRTRNGRPMKDARRVMESH